MECVRAYAGVEYGATALRSAEGALKLWGLVDAAAGGRGSVECCLLRALTVVMLVVLPGRRAALASVTGKRQVDKLLCRLCVRDSPGRVHCWQHPCLSQTGTCSVRYGRTYCTCTSQAAYSSRIVKAGP